MRTSLMTTLVAVFSLAFTGTAFAADEPSASAANTPPKGFVALFNGKDLDGWRGLKPDTNPYEIAKWKPEEKERNQKAANEDMAKHWRVENGEIVNDGGGAYLTTVKDYRDFELRVDWRMMAPNGDSGIYLRGTPQVQIWDPANPGVKALGADKGSGALWNNSEGAAGRFPPVKADRPVGEWNTFRIVMIGQRVSVWLNDQQTVDHAIMENYWDRKRPIPATGPIELQTHGSEMRFRNVFIHEINAEEANKTLQARDDEGFKAIFNGRNLDGWIGDTDAYTVKDGVMVFSAKGGGDIFAQDVYADFAIRFEFKLPPGGNNGLLIRVPKAEHGGSYSGMEIQILDDYAEKWGDLQAWQYNGSVYGIAPAQRGYLRPAGEWNFEEVIVGGSKIKVLLNGTLVVDVDLSKVEKPLDGNEHPGMKRTDGYIGFMGHGDPVEFRNIRVKKLGNAGAKSEK